MEWLRRAGVDYDDAILDVGCGAGHLLLNLYTLGFIDLTGVDPYLPADSEPAPGVRRRKADAADLAGAYDFVMLHHSLENVPDPAATLEAAFRLLRPGRLALVRVPVAGTHAWRTYGPDWVQLDAPRHRAEHTGRRRSGMLLPAEGVDLRSPWSRPRIRRRGAAARPAASGLGR